MQDEGAVVIGGARLRFADTFEFRVGAEYADTVSSAMSGIIGEASATVGFDLHMTDVTAITVEVKHNEESVSSGSVGIRFYPTKVAPASLRSVGSSFSRDLRNSKRKRRSPSGAAFAFTLLGKTA